MAAGSSASTQSNAERELTITRIFDAPRSLVFKAWIEPERQARWLGPKGFTTVLCEIDARPGGAFRFCMRSPEGTELWLHGMSREIIEPERLVLTTGEWVDAEGKPSHETLLTLTLADQGGKTKLTLRQSAFDSATTRDSNQGGWNSALDCLTEYLATAQ